MKTLKSFIFFTCLLALLSTKLNAQMLLTTTSYPPPNGISMVMSESRIDDNGNGIAHTTNAIGVAEVLVTLSSTTPARLAVAIYATPYSSGDTPLHIYKNPFVDITFVKNIIFDGFEGDSVYVECGYMQGAEYVSDGGCTVFIEP